MFFSVDDVYSMIVVITCLIPQLENINDEEPVFSSALYEAEVPENSPPATAVINVTATDADKGQYGVLTYSLAGQS